MKNFKNKNVVITGAGSGIGAACANEFAKLGANLGLCDIDIKNLEIVKQGIEKLNNRITVYTQKVDVSKEDEVYDFAESVKNKIGDTHIIINNAGIEASSLPIYKLDNLMIKKVMNINFWGVVYGTKAFLPHIVANKEGAVVNISSIAGLIGMPNHGGYCASKFAVRGFTEALMAEFSDSPIGIHCVHPGGIATNLIKDNNGADFSRKYLTTPPEKIAKYMIKCIKQKRSKIVYGNNSLKAWLGSNFVPQDILNKITWWEIKTVVDKKMYGEFLGKS